MTVLRILDEEDQALVDAIKYSPNPFQAYLAAISTYPDSDRTIIQHLRGHLQELIDNPSFATMLAYQDGSLADSELVRIALIRLAGPTDGIIIPSQGNIQKNLVKARPLDALGLFHSEDSLLKNISPDDLIKQASDSSITDVLWSLNDIKDLKPEFVDQIPQIISAAKPEQPNPYSDTAKQQEYINQLMSELCQKYHLRIEDLEQAVKQAQSAVASSQTPCNLLETTHLPWEYIPASGSETPAARLNLNQPAIFGKYQQLKDTPDWQGISSVTGPDVGKPHSNTGNVYLFLPPESVKTLASRLNEASNTCEAEHQKTSSSSPKALGEFLANNFETERARSILAYVENNIQSQTIPAITHTQGEPSYA